MKGDVIAVVLVPGLRQSNSVGEERGCVDIWRGGVDALSAWLDGQQDIGFFTRGDVLKIFTVNFRNYLHYFCESTCVIAPAYFDAN